MNAYKSALPRKGATAWNRHGKLRVLAVAEGHVMYRPHGGSPQVMSALAWSKLKSNPWTDSDCIIADAEGLLEYLHLPANAQASVAISENGWIVYHVGRPPFVRLLNWKDRPVEYSELKSPIKMLAVPA